MTFEEYLNDTGEKDPLFKDRSAMDRFMASLSLGKDPHFSLEDFSDSDKVRILGMTASTLASQNDIIRSEVYLEQAYALAKKNLSKNDPANLALAVAGNNLACALENKTNLSHQEINLMIHAAFIARKFWEIAGTWKEVERAEYRLAKTFLKADVLDRAFDHAEKCLSIIAENKNEPLEVFLGFEAMALIEKARKNELGFTEAREKMEEAFKNISPYDQARCKEILDKMEGLPSTII